MNNSTLQYIEPGLNIITNASNVSGLDIAIHSIVNTLNYLHIPVTMNTSDDEFPILQQKKTSYPVSLLGFNLDHYTNLSSPALINLTQRTYTIAHWTYELSQIPQRFYPAFRDIDEIWAPSYFTQQSMLRYAQCPVHIVPYPVVLPNNIGKNRTKYHIPIDRFMFLFTFSVSSTEARKNPFAIIEAFQQAFGCPDESGPILVIKAQNIEQYPILLEDLSRALHHIGGILIKDTLSRENTLELLNTADCYISLHRSEGFGLGMAESMYLGKSVIATGYSGNIDFMNEANSYLVSYVMRKISYKDHVYEPQGQNLYPVGFEWAEPDLYHAASLMKHVFDTQQEAYTKGILAAQTMRQDFGYEKIGKIIQDRLNNVYNEGAQKRSLQYPLPIWSAKNLKSDRNELFHRHIMQYQDQARDIVVRYRQLLGSWEQVKSSNQSSFLYKIPILGRGLHIFRQLLLQGRINVEQSLINQINLEHLEQDIHTLSNFMHHIDNRITEVDQQITEITQMLKNNIDEGS